MHIKCINNRIYLPYVAYCDICGCELDNENETSYSNMCIECAGSGAEILMHFLGWYGKFFVSLKGHQRSNQNIYKLIVCILLWPS